MGSKRLKYIELGKVVHQDKYDYSKIEAINKTTDRVTIVCPIHGDFVQSVSSHFLQKCGCRKCGNIATGKASALSSEKFIMNSAILHAGKYDYSKVGEIKDSRSIVTIICPEHGEFEQTVHIHLHGKAGCSKCGLVAFKKATTTNLEKFLAKAHKAHGDKYDYSYVLEINGTYDKIKIVCPEHGEFTQAVNNHINVKSGCPLCGKISKAPLPLSQNKFLERCIKVHGKRYDYTKTVYSRMEDDVVITCSKHGDFTQRASGHTSGHGCAKCALENRTYEHVEFLEKCALIHNYKYDYSPTIYNRIGDILTISCPNHGIFKQMARLHIEGYGCRKCKSSRGEASIMAFLVSKNIVFEHEKTFDSCVSVVDADDRFKLRFDFYLPAYNTCIEFDGEQHFRPVSIWGGKSKFIELQCRDTIKTKWCEDNGVPLIRISYTDKNNIQAILKKALNV